MKFLKALLGLGLYLVLAQANADPNNIKVFAANYPLAYFAERICGSPNTIAFPNINSDPAFWSPTPNDILSIQESDVILINGATYEKWLEDVSLPTRKIVDTSVDFKDKYISITSSVNHAHGKDGKHAHTGTAFTTWIDFKLAVEQARSVKTALERTGHWSKQFLDERFNQLNDDLVKIDSEIETLVKGKEKTALIGSHPVYDYFARRYHLNLKSVHWEPDNMPDKKMWDELRSLLEKHPAKWMIWEAQPHSEIVAKLKSMGIKSVVFDPTAIKPKDGDFITAMRKNVNNLRKVFKGA